MGIFSQLAADVMPRPSDRDGRRLSLHSDRPATDSDRSGGAPESHAPPKDSEHHDTRAVTVTVTMKQKAKPK
eukprot:2394933-Rhodomonas_salina.2